MPKIFLSPMLSLSLVFLIGCENETIKNIKKSPINSNLTFAQALENAPYCNNSEWSYSEDQNKRSVVKHTCRITIKSSNIEKYAEKATAVEDLRAWHIAGIEKVKYELRELNNNIITAKNFSKKAE